jgi:hypothetical protein
MPITDTYELTVIDLSPSTNEETSSQAPAISTYSSADVDVTKTYEIFANNGTASSSSIIEFLAIPQITTTIPINQLAIATQTSSRRVFESFNREISYTSSEETQSGMSLSTVSGFFSNSVYSNIYEAVTTRTINAQAAFETSLSSTFSESNPNTNAFDYGRTVSEGENKTVISQNINQARTTKFFSSPRRTIKKLTGVRNNADLVVGFYAAQGIAGSTFYPDFNDGLAIYPLASRNVHTVHPRTYRYFTDPFDESEAGTISISGLNGSGTNQFGTFTFALIPSGSANTTSVVLADSIGIGVANLGKFETAYQSISAGVYSRFGGTVRYESPQFLSFANEQSAAVEKLIPITGFTTETFLFRNAYSMIWTAPRNSVDLPPDMP